MCFFFFFFFVLSFLFFLVSVPSQKSEEADLVLTRRMTPFTNGARSDGLILRHWQRSEESSKPSICDGAETNGDENRTADMVAKNEESSSSSPSQREYPFAKYNIKAQLPHRYTDEEYNGHLLSEDWTREETDYLMDLVEEYDLRWILIADRYDYQAHIAEDEAHNTKPTAIVPAGMPTQERTVEQMKSRYYFVAAVMLALQHPPSEMSEAEFDLHEKMMKFDPAREKARKELSAMQLSRTADEVREEGILLEELKRITANEQNFVAERRELYARLEVPVSVGNTAMYQSSQGLGQLLQSLLQADRTKKRRSLIGGDGISIPAGPASGQAINGRDGSTTPSTAGGPHNKRGSVAGAAANKETQHAPKILSPMEEAKYGVQHHDRLTAGVQFRSDRAQRLTQAKSNVQTQKLAFALAELEVPLRLVMPTEPVVKEFEKLIHSVNTLLDARKVSEKVEGEIRVLESARDERERRANEAKSKESNPVIKTEAQDKPAPPVPASPPSANGTRTGTAAGGRPDNGT